MDKLKPDDNMIDFHPMSCGKDDDSSTIRYLKMGQVFDPVRKRKFRSRVKQWLEQYIKTNHRGETVLMAIAPGHQRSDSNDSSFMYDLIGEFISEYPHLKMEDGRDLLQRHETIPKQSAAGANRNEHTHRESIRINAGEDEDLSQLNKGKIVIILDDVWTSGCTLRVCEEKVHTTGPKDVKLLAIGRTVHRM